MYHVYENNVWFKGVCLTDLGQNLDTYDEYNSNKKLDLIQLKLLMCAKE